MRVGTDVGLLAHQLFPGGVLVEAEPWERDESVARTQALLADPNVPAIFEAGFLYDGLHARADVLKRKPSGAFGLYEVKSTGEVKDQHIPDLAFQVHVARGSGLVIDETGILYINKEYERGAELDVQRLFAFSDEKARVEEYLAGIDERLAAQKVLLLGSPPTVEPGPHCHDPYECEFWGRCTEKKPDDWVFYLPRLGKRWDELRSRGIESIRAIPDDFSLTELQARIRDVLRSGKPYVGPGLADALAEVQAPVIYLDFETVNPAVPLWPGTYPFQRIPFQWSLHRMTGAGDLTHAEFLADSSGDPRRVLAVSLVEHLGSTNEKIVVYNKGFEGSVIRELAELHGDLAPALRSIEDRLWDLLPVVRSHVYLSVFGGSFSIKSVAPALVSEIDYTNLDGITEGMEASDAFMRLATSSLFQGETERALRHALLTYCQLDTLAMAKAHEALCSMTRIDEVHARPSAQL